MPVVEYVSSLPAETLLAPAAIWIGTAPVGMTDGGLGWDPEITQEALMPDGARAYLKGLIRRSKFGGKASGKLWQIASTDQLAVLEPGSTSATGTPPVTTIVTPKGAGIMYADGDYVTDLRFIWETVEGSSYYALYIPIALCAKYSIPETADGKVSIPFEFWPCNDPAVSITAAPFKYELRSGLPA